MVNTGDVITNPAMGATIRFRQIGADTGGALTEFDFFLRPGGIIAEDHFHPKQEERFEVIAGAVRGHVNGESQTVLTGGSSVIAPGVAHGWRNATPSGAHLRVQFRPALRSEEFFSTAFALARAGRTDRRGVPRFPDRLFVVAAFADEFQPAGMPTWVHTLVVHLLKPVSRRVLSRILRSRDELDQMSVALDPPNSPTETHGGTL